MSKTIIVDNSVQKYIESLLRNNQTCCGLIIGQHGATRDYVIHMARTPHREKDKSGAAAEVTLDDKLLSNHARQAQRMLPGGFDIVGMFICANPQTTKSWQPLLKQALVNINKTLSKNEIVLERSKAFNLKMALQICTATKKISCKVVNVSDYKSGLEPAEWKYQNLGSCWVSGRTTITVDHAILVDMESCNKAIKKQLQDGLEPLCNQVWNSLITVNNNYLSADLPLCKDKSDTCTWGDELDLQVFLEPIADSSKEEAIVSDCIARLHIRGTMACQAFVHSRSTINDLQMALREDVVRSLLARCELMCEEMLPTEETEDEKVLYETPKRIFAPLHDSRVHVCDYLFPDEQSSDCISRLQELLHLTVSEDDIDVSREQLLGPADLQEEEQLEQQSVSSSSSLVPQPVRQHNNKPLLAVAVTGLLVSIAVGCISYVFG